MRRAKIVCTLGPASSDINILRKMVESGMDVARLNFSHGTHADHRETFEKIRSLSKEMGRPISILQDLQGPKIRVGKFEDGGIDVVAGDKLIITSEDIIGNKERVSTTYKGLPHDVKPGDVLLVDDGLFCLRVDRVDGEDVHTVVEIGGRLKNNKGINLPTAAVSAPTLTAKDKIDLAFGMELGVDYIALSFVRSALDLHQTRALIPDKNKGVKIISKIEKPQAVTSLKEIIAVSDGIMIARGDLGVELPPQNVPVIQKRAIVDANAQGKISITATQMLESMTTNARPTRAEASDVANAILDGTDAVMLSGETASGKYPVESVKMMASIIKEVESSPVYRRVPHPDFIKHHQDFPNAIAKSAAVVAEELDVKGIVVITRSGSTAKLMMTYRPNKPIIACTPSAMVYQQLGLFWGVRAHHIDLFETEPDADPEFGDDHTLATAGVLERMESLMVQHYKAKVGDKIIVVLGYPLNEPGEANMMKLHKIE